MSLERRYSQQFAAIFMIKIETIELSILACHRSNQTYKEDPWSWSEFQVMNTNWYFVKGSVYEEF